MPSGVFQLSAPRSPPGADFAAAARHARSAPESSSSDAVVIVFAGSVGQIIAVQPATIGAMAEPIVCLVAAVTPDGGIGYCGRLLVRLPEDLRRFKRLTLGSPVVMGRKT